MRLAISDRWILEYTHGRAPHQILNQTQAGGSSRGVSSDIPEIAAVSVFSSSIAMVIGPTPPGTGVIQPARSLAAANSTSPLSLPSGRRRDADIEHDRAGLDPVTANQSGLADRNRQDVGLRDMAGEIPREAMADRDGGAGQQQFQRQRPADMVGCADDHRMLAADRHTDMPQQRHHAVGRGRTQDRHALAEAAEGIGVKAIDILDRIDALDDCGFVDVRRQRQLDEDAVDIVIEIEPVDQCQQFGLARAGRQVMVARDHADFGAGRALVAHIDL